VALKVPRADKLAAPDDLEQFLSEARSAASLRHAGIVTIYDVQETDDGIFIVLEFVEGCTLSQHAARERLSLDEAVRLMIEIAQAVAYAHEHGFVHRDLKPSNILVDVQGSIRITDFGLAIHERGQHLLVRDTAGTPSYMAPEQVRGETHRLDGRTDVWSLGVILYWLLTGRRAFQGESQLDIFDEILNSEPRPPRQMAPHVPRELERICMKCMSKRMSDRYPTAHDLADDLVHWLNPNPQVKADSTATTSTPSDKLAEQAEVRVIPKGLRSFDQNDADFYLQLLPGPYDRHGVPESVRFWKQRIDQRDASSTFAVGLMYGPSGCGKTSLVRAGVMPRLAAHVHCVYVETLPEETENRIQRGIMREFPVLPARLSLSEALVELREGKFLRAGEKLLIVLDQFEQWLSGRQIHDAEPLVRALRHCDGGSLQCLLMVRDDFGMAATRFMNALEIPIVEGQNCAAIDVLHRDHAQRVLRWFGEAFGRLSLGAPADGDRFIEQAVELLCEGNFVTPVRLAAFAELTRHQDWNASTLKHLGGGQGWGVALLETHLGEEVVNPTHRQHRSAARKVLAALLPDDRTTLKGHMRSSTELMAAAGYIDRPREFDALIHLLDKELRLITPADPQHGVGESSDAESGGRRERHFQLAHDYLVPSINAWLTEKQRETRAGRAALLLESISHDWNARPDLRRLPTVGEWLSLRFWTHPASWTPVQARMMAAARRRYLTRLGTLIVLVAVVVTSALFVYRHEQHRWQEEQARAVAEQLLVADASRVPEILRQLDALASPTAREVLATAAEVKQPSSAEWLRAQLYLARDDASAREPLLQSLLAAGPDEHRIIAARLAPHATTLAPKLWDEIANNGSDDRVLRAASALAAWDADGPAWSSQAKRVSDALVRYTNPYYLPAWIEALVPVRRRLTEPLKARFRDASLSPTERSSAATALVRFLRSDVAELAPLIVDATAESFAVFLSELEAHPGAALDALSRQWVDGKISEDPALRDASAKRRAVAAVALARLGSETAFWSALEGALSPDLRTAVIDRCAPYGIPPEMLLSGLDSSRNPLARQSALIVLAEYGNRHTSESTNRLLAQSLRLYEQDPHSGVHSAAEYVLRRLGKHEELAARRAALADQQASGRNWTVNKQGITMVIVRGPREFVQGSPPSEIERDNFEPQKSVRLPHSFAISAHEITVEQFLRFQPKFEYATVVTPSLDCPVSNVTWLDAAKYCRWLSEAEGIAEEEMCYPAVEKIDDKTELHREWQRRTGYRLPAEAEWELASRADTSTARFFGQSPAALDRYAVYIGNSSERLWSVGSFRPNPWGLFDVYGNVVEWCQDLSPSSPEGPDGENTEPELRRVVRSGTYRSVHRENRSATRYHYPPMSRRAFLGLRVVRTVRD
jgi:formylglycine-generating enzyme required for sulfatase activity